MPLQKTLQSSLRETLPRKYKLRTCRFVFVCMTAAVLQFAHPATALCESPSEATIVRQAAPVSEQPRQSFSSMKSFFNDVTHYFGTRYRFGGQTPAGFDCSGFVRFMYDKVFNMRLPRSSREMSALGNKVSKEELQPGDLVFFQTKGQQINHVGIFIGNDTFVHSSLSKGITEDQLKHYYEKRFAGAVRILDQQADKLPSLPAQSQPTEDITEPS